MCSSDLTLPQSHLEPTILQLPATWHLGEMTMTTGPNDVIWYRVKGESIFDTQPIISSSSNGGPVLGGTNSTTITAATPLSTRSADSGVDKYYRFLAVAPGTVLITSPLNPHHPLASPVNSTMVPLPDAGFAQLGGSPDVHPLVSQFASWPGNMAYSGRGILLQDGVIWLTDRAPGDSPHFIPC